MPYIYHIPKSQYWQARYKSPEGKWRTVSTKLTNRHDAQKMAEELEGAASGKHTGAEHLREVFNALHRELYRTEMPKTSFRSFAADWLKAGKLQWAESSYDAYEKTAELFNEYLGSRADSDLVQLSSSDCIGFRNWLAQSRSVDTTNGYVKKLRMIFKAARRDKYILENPAEFVDRLKNRNGEAEASRRALTVKEIRAVLQIADPEWQSLIKFGLYTGQRLGDLARLTFANVDLEADEIRLVTTKTGKRLSIPMAAPLRDHVLSLSWPDDPKTPVHPAAFATVTATGRVVTLSNQFVELLAQAGLREVRTHASRGIGRDGKRERPQISFHSLRYSAVTLLKAAGIPHATVQELIGHESEVISQHYTTVDEVAKRKATRAFPKL
jgi:integrase